MKIVAAHDKAMYMLDCTQNELDNYGSIPSWDHAYSELNTIQQLANAESFSELCECICP